MDAAVEQPRLTHVHRRERRGEMAIAVAAGSSVDDTAARFGVTSVTVRKACKEHHRSTQRKRGRKPGTPNPTARKVEPEDWEAADWNLRDIDLSYVLGVSRERVRQKRVELKKAKPAFAKRASRFFLFKQWAEENRETLAGLRAEDVRAVSPVPASWVSIKNWCDELGITLATPLRADQIINRHNLEILTVKRQFREGMSACWEMKNLSGNSAYPRIGAMTAHHFAYRIFHGEPSPGLWILHRCDNPKCVNPEHLYEGTAKNNADDRTAFGNSTGRKLTQEQVDEIRLAYEKDKRNNRIDDLAKRFGLSWMSVWKIVKGRNWTSREERDRMPAGRIKEALRLVSTLSATFTTNDLMTRLGWESVTAATSLYSMRMRGFVFISKKRCGRRGAEFSLTNKGLEVVERMSQAEAVA